MKLWIAVLQVANSRSIRCHHFPFSSDIPSFHIIILSPSPAVPKTSRSHAVHRKTRLKLGWGAVSRNGECQSWGLQLTIQIWLHIIINGHYIYIYYNIYIIIIIFIIIIINYIYILYILFIHVHSHDNPIISRCIEYWSAWSRPCGSLKPLGLRCELAPRLAITWNRFLELTIGYHIDMLINI